eukprot:scaffold24884_cov67-Phaeocystis_antarctica.AAC.7
MVRRRPIRSSKKAARARPGSSPAASAGAAPHAALALGAVVGLSAAATSDGCSSTSPKKSAQSGSVVPRSSRPKSAASRALSRATPSAPRALSLWRQGRSVAAAASGGASARSAAVASSASNAAVRPLTRAATRSRGDSGRRGEHSRSSSDGAAERASRPRQPQAVGSTSHARSASSSVPSEKKSRKRMRCEPRCATAHRCERGEALGTRCDEATHAGEQQRADVARAAATLVREQADAESTDEHASEDTRRDELLAARHGVPRSGAPHRVGGEVGHEHQLCRVSDLGEGRQHEEPPLVPAIPDRLNDLVKRLAARARSGEWRSVHEAHGSRVLCRVHGKLTRNLTLLVPRRRAQRAPTQRACSGLAVGKTKRSKAFKSVQKRSKVSLSLVAAPIEN